MINIYTDGSFCDSLGFGAWGFFCPAVNQMHVGVIQARNSNEIELYAALMAATHFGRDNIRLYSDSRYVVDGGSTLAKQWANQGWVSSGNRTINDRLYWTELIRQIGSRKAEFIWIQAHRKHAGNHEIDRAVKSTMRNYKQLIKEENI